MVHAPWSVLQVLPEIVHPVKITSKRGITLAAIFFLNHIFAFCSIKMVFSTLQMTLNYYTNTRKKFSRQNKITYLRINLTFKSTFWPWK